MKQIILIADNRNKNIRFTGERIASYENSITNTMIKDFYDLYEIYITDNDKYILSISRFNNKKSHTPITHVELFNTPSKLANKVLQQGDIHTCWVKAFLEHCGIETIEDI